MSRATKVWVRRPNSSPTRIQIPSSTSTPIFSPTASGWSTRDTPRHVDVELTEDFLVDDLREAILRKYPQSLGKHHDSADLSIRIPLQLADGIIDSEAGRILSPDESVIKILMEEYPNGQKSDEAWTVITSGGRDNYTRWWLQTGGFSDQLPIRTGFSPNYSTGGSFGPEAINQEYFPYVPQTVVTPPGEFPSRSRASGSSMMSQYPRSQQGRPSLRPTRSNVAQDGLFPRRYDNTNTSSMVVEPLSGPESEISRSQGRNSPDISNLRYPPSLRPSSAISSHTPPGEFPNRLRQYTPGNKQVVSSASAQSFQMQLPSQMLPTIPQKVQSPIGGPPNQPRLSAGSVTRPIITTMSTANTPAIPADKPSTQPKGATSPKSPASGNSPNSGGVTGGGTTTSTSPVTRRKSNTSTGQPLPLVNKSQSPSPVDERVESPRPPRVLPLVKPKAEKDAVTTKNSVLGLIPPINVLIVEDNIINAQILEAFFRKRKLKYATAVNGKQAVEKWRQGGWHLVLV